MYFSQFGVKQRVIICSLWAALFACLIDITSTGNAKRNGNVVEMSHSARCQKTAMHHHYPSFFPFCWLLWLKGTTCGLLLRLEGYIRFAETVTDASLPSNQFSDCRVDWQQITVIRLWKISTKNCVCKYFVVQLPLTSAWVSSSIVTRSWINKLSLLFVRLAFSLTSACITMCFSALAGSQDAIKRMFQAVHIRHAAGIKIMTVKPHHWDMRNGLKSKIEASECWRN